VAVKFSNNGKTTLASNITSSATSISVTDGSVFPTLSGGDTFFMTLEDLSGNIEIVSVTARSGNTLTVTRAQEGTTARAFSSPDKAENRLTAAGLNSFVSDSGDTIDGGDLTVNGEYTDNVFMVDYSSGRVGVNLGSGNTPSNALHVNGTVQFSGAGSQSGYQTTLTTYASSTTFYRANGDLSFVAGASSYPKLTLTNAGALTYGGSTVWHAGNDGSGSGLDADTVDGIQASSFLRSNANDSHSGILTLDVVEIGNEVRFPTNTSLTDVSLTHTTDQDTGFNWSGSNAVNYVSGGVLKYNLNNVWHSGNDGASSGLDADTVDGLHASSFLRSDASDVYGGRVLEFGNAGNGQNTAGAFLTIEGNTDSSGEGSGRLFFREHNSSTASADNFGMSLGYRGGSTSVTTAMGNSWTGLASIGNGEWGMWGHDNSVTGSLIAHGPRSGAYSDFTGLKVGGNNVWHAGNDGSGSGLDADTLDGLDSSSFVQKTSIVNCNNASAGWYRIATSSAGDGRGAFEIRLYTYGGANAPGMTIIRGTKGYGTSAPKFYSVEFSGDSLRATKIRGVQSTDDKGHIEAYFGAARSNLAIEVKREGIGGFVAPTSTTLVAADATNDAVSSEIDILQDRSNFVGEIAREGHKVWDAGNDGTGSGLDADTVDGLQASQFVRSDANDTLSGTYLFNRTTTDPAIDISGHAGASSYNYFLRARNDGGNRAVMFVNGSTRTADGGPNAVTIRNDGGPLVLGHASNSTKLIGTGDLTYNGNEIWHAGNDGAGSGLDADLLDGRQPPTNWAVTAQTYTTIASGAWDLPTGSSVFSKADSSGGPSDNGYWFVTGRRDTGGGYSGIYTPHNDGNFYVGYSLTGNANPTWYKGWTAGNDGSGSGLDADTVDGIQASSFLRSDANDTTSGTLTVTGGEVLVDKIRCNGGQQLVLNAGESNGFATGQAGELVYMNAEDGVQINSSTDNWVGGWANRRTTTITGTRITVDGNYWEADDDTWNKFYTTHGYIGLGPANTSWGHIYTDRPGFYFNKTNLQASGNQIWHAGNDGSGSGLDADMLDGQHGSYYYSSANLPPKLFAGGVGPSTENLNTVANSVSVGQLEYRGFNSSSTNAPPMSDNANGVITVGQHSGNYNAQLAFSSDGNMYWRDNPSTTNGSWREVWDSGNDGSGSGLDADTVDGLQASQFLRSDVADTAVKLNFGVGGVQAPTSSDATTGARLNLYPIGSGRDYTIGIGPNTMWFNSDDNYKWYVDGSLKFEWDNAVSQFEIGGNKVWHAGNDGGGSGLDADTVDGWHKSGFTHAEASKTWSGINAASTQAKRYHVARLYGCPAHWDSNWQNIEFHVTAESYESGSLKFKLMGDYGGAGSQANMIKIYLKEVDGPMVNRFRFVLGTPVDAGWNHSGQDTFYVDLYAEAAHYAQWKIHAKTFGHGILSSNPTSGGATTVFYDSPTASNVSTFDVSYNDTYTRGNKIWSELNDGSGSGLDADLLDGVQGSSFLRSDANDSASGTLTLNGEVISSRSVHNYFRIESSNTSEAMIRYNNSTSNLWYTGIRATTSNGLGTSDYHIYSSAAGQSVLGVTAAGTAISKNQGTLWGSSNDGSGSGLDADTVDGLHASSFEPANSTIIHQGSDISSQDWNVFIDGTEASWNTVVNASGSNKPPNYTYGQSLSISKSTQAKFQLYASHTASAGNGLYYRSGWNTDYKAWVEIWDSGNDGSGSGLDADTVDGVQASSFVRSDADDTKTGVLNLQANLDMRNDSATAARYIHLPRGGGITLYGDGNIHHGIFSRNEGMNATDDIIISSYNGLHIDLDSNNNNTTGSNFTIGKHNTATSQFTFNGETSDLTVSGNVTAYSDKRLKDNIETLDGSKVYDMRGVSFTKEGRAGSGVVAQELQAVAPELVNEDGEYLSVAYGNVVGYLIEAIKELKTEVDDLKTQLAEKG
jgi:hypothetical protein